MSYTLKEEYQNLLRIISLQSPIRIGDCLKTRCGDKVFVRTITEFVWAYCYNPYFAKALVEKLRKTLNDTKEYHSILARSNQEVGPETLFEEYDEAKNNSNIKGNKAPISYSIEYSHDINQEILYATSEDGDLWNGIAITDSCLEQISKILVQIESVDDQYDEWITTYSFEKDQILEDCRDIFEGYEYEGDEERWFHFTPFKHPFILRNVNAKLRVAFMFNDGFTFEDFRDEEEKIRMLYGVASDDFQSWLECGKFKLELAMGDKYIVNTAKETITN